MEPMSIGGAPLPETISSIYGGAIAIKEMLTHLHDKCTVGYHDGSYGFGFYCDIDSLEPIDINHFIPKNKNIRLLYCERYKDGAAEIYFCRIQTMSIDVENGTITIWARVAEKDYGPNRDYHFNDAEMKVLKADYLDEKIMPDMIPISNRFELLDLE